MAHVTFYTHQTVGMCAGMCTGDRTHQMEKTVINLLYASNIVIRVWEDDL